MMIRVRDLQSASTRYFTANISKSSSQARAAQDQTAFVCHSHLDRELVNGLQILLRENGWQVYLDWEDATMPDKPDRTTAMRIQEKIRELQWFLFLATRNSVVSRWCPWEIGYADQVKQDKVLIIPTEEDGGTWHGNEYLQLYRRIAPAEAGGLLAVDPGAQRGMWIRDLRVR